MPPRWARIGRTSSIEHWRTTPRQRITMSNFYLIDSTRVSHREYWWGTRSPLVLIGWLLKWLHVRIPGSTDDPNVESTIPFVVEALPAEAARRFDPIAAELAGLGFFDPVYH